MKVVSTIFEAGARPKFCVSCLLSHSLRASPGTPAPLSLAFIIQYGRRRYPSSAAAADTEAIGADITIGNCRACSCMDVHSQIFPLRGGMYLFPNRLRFLSNPVPARPLNPFVLSCTRTITYSCCLFPSHTRLHH